MGNHFFLVKQIWHGAYYTYLVKTKITTGGI